MFEARMVTYKVMQPAFSDCKCECGCYMAVLIMFVHNLKLALCRNCLEMVRAGLKEGFKEYEQGRLTIGEKVQRLGDPAWHEVD